jgi:hypothetical protein
MFQLKQIKPALLAGLMAIGFAFQSAPVQAAGTETLTLAGGCFWCIESDFESVKGVKDVVSGYTGGKRVLTRFGAVKQSDAYKKCRKGCGRDARVKQLWGAAAPFASR